MINVMKDRIVGIVLFWAAAAVVPCVCLFIISKVYGAVWFSIALLIYLFFYRPLVVIIRLLSLKAIEEKDAWKFFIPFYHNKYFKTMWLG